MSEIEKGRVFNCTHGNWEQERFALESEITTLKSSHDFLAKQVDERQKKIERLENLVNDQDRAIKFAGSEIDRRKAELSQYEHESWKSKAEKLRKASIEYYAFPSSHNRTLLREALAEYEKDQK